MQDLRPDELGQLGLESRLVHAHHGREQFVAELTTNRRGELGHQLDLLVVFIGLRSGGRRRDGGSGRGRGSRRSRRLYLRGRRERR